MKGNKRSIRPIAKLGYKLEIVCFTQRQVRALGLDPTKTTTSDLRKYVWDALNMDSRMEDQLNNERAVRKKAKDSELAEKKETKKKANKK